MSHRFPTRSLSFGLVAGIVLAAALPAAAKEVAGVTVSDTLTVQGKALKLNGAGLRKKAIFKVYVGALYLETASKDPVAILASDESKAVQMHFLRSVGKEKLVEGFQEGFENNAKDRMAAAKAEIGKFLGYASDVKDGDVWTFAYTPGKGTSVMHGTQELGTIEGKDFVETLFLLWLGPKPPSEDLKKGMLGI